MAENNKNMDYKLKFEESQAQIQRLATVSNKACQNYHLLNKKYIQANKEQESLKLELKEKEDLISKLKNVSEAVCNDFSSLKSQYRKETEAIAVNMKKASKWYHENKKLKRKSIILTQKMVTMGAFSSVDIDLDKDEGDGDGESEEDLNQQVTDLTIELKTAKLKLEDEEEKGKLKDDRILELEDTINEMRKVSKMVVDEFNELKNEKMTAVEVAKTALSEAQTIRKERNAIARKSAMLFLEQPPDQKLHEALMEIEKLSKQLEDASNEYNQQIDELKTQLDENAQQKTENVLREKIEILEKQLDQADSKWQDLERQNAKYSQQVRELEQKLARNGRLIGPPTIPPPPPPPPPPIHNPIRSLINIISLNKKTKKKHGNNQGSKAPENDARNEVISEMMAKIKSGNIQLKPAKKMKDTVDNEGAVDEMRKMLHSLKKSPSSTDSSSESVKSNESSELERALKKRKNSRDSGKNINDEKVKEKNSHEIEESNGRVLEQRNETDDSFPECDEETSEKLMSAEVNETNTKNKTQNASRSNSKFFHDE